MFEILPLTPYVYSISYLATVQRKEITKNKLFSSTKVLLLWSPVSGYNFRVLLLNLSSRYILSNFLSLDRGQVTDTINIGAER